MNKNLREEKREGEKEKLHTSDPKLKFYYP